MTPSAAEDVQPQGRSFAAGGNRSSAAPLEDSLVVSYKLNTRLLYDPAIVLFGIYPKEVKTMSTQKLAHGCL